MGKVMGLMSEASFITKLSAPALRAAAEFLKKHPEGIGAAVGGAGALGYQYLKNRKKGDAPSAEQSAAKEELSKALKDVKKEKSFGTELGAAKAKAHHEIAGIMAKHPFKGALLAAPAGALGGASAVSVGKRLLALAK